MKTLGEYADACGDLLIQVSGDRATAITDIQSDSRDVTPGTLFMAIQGSVTDGHDFIDQAIANGAVAVACKTPPPDLRIPALTVADDYRALGLMAELAADNPVQGMMAIGITGTNGKTTTAFQLAEIFRQAGRKTGMIGTVYYDLGTEHIPADRTTPTPIRLQALLAQMRDNGVEVVVMEVSSHALAQGRIGAMTFDATIFCNQTQEHLDYHRTMEHYYLAKKRLFADHLKPDGTAVINIDSPFGQRLIDELDCRIITFGRDAAADNRLLDSDQTIDGSRMLLSDGFAMTPLIGAYNIENVMGAMSAARAVGIGETAIRDGVAEFKGVPGRLQRVLNDGGLNVFIDYAHTSDALEKALTNIRPLCAQKLSVVFGCGGDRDSSKRAVMGAIAVADADVAIITSDNPRSETPDTIIEDILVGVPEEAEFTVEPDRRKAIAKAIDAAAPGDTILVAGKGHEAYQEIDGVKYPFSDYAVTDELLREKADSSS